MLNEFDDLLRAAVTKICNVTLSDDQWTQASLPVRSGGLGVRSVSKLASSAFLASAASTLSLQTLILQRTQVNEIDISQSLVHWKCLSNGPRELVQPQDSSQRAWDTAVINHSFTSLLDAQTEPYHRARLLAVVTGCTQCPFLHVDYAWLTMLYVLQSACVSVPNSARYISVPAVLMWIPVELMPSLADTILEEPSATTISTI